MGTAHAQIGEWLGIETPATHGDILRVVEHRFPPSIIQRIVKLGLERSEIDSLVIPARTLQHRRSRREKLTTDESDRVMKVIRVLAQAEDVYGSRERALAWLRRENPRLGGRTPLSLLKTDTGSRIVEETLIQLDEGMFV